MLTWQLQHLLLDIHANVVQGLHSLGFTREQQSTVAPPEPARASPDTVTAPSLSDIHAKVVQAIRCLGFDCNHNSYDLQRSVVQCTPEFHMNVQPGSDPSTVRSSPNNSWAKNYSALSFLMNGQLFAEYERVSNTLGIPSCSKNQWLRIVDWTEKHVTGLAEWSCEQERNQVHKRGDHQQWVASHDGFYLT